MNDNLDQLTDAELSECFAVEVQGWRRTTMEEMEKFVLSGETFIPMFVDGRTFKMSREPFATSADSVLPHVKAFLDKSMFSQRRAFWEDIARSAITGRENWVAAYPDCIGLHISFGTLARSLCIALIRAKRTTRNP